VIESGANTSESWACDIGVQLADSLHPVTSPAVDSFGNIYTPSAIPRPESSGSSLPHRPALQHQAVHQRTDECHPIAIDPEGMIYIPAVTTGLSTVTPNGNMSVYVEGMGVATGLTFDGEQNLYVGDRSGTIFKVSPSRQIFVFATLEQSISATTCISGRTVSCM